MPHVSEPSRHPHYLLGLLYALTLTAFFLVALIRLHEDISHPRIEHLDHALLEGLHTHDTPALTALARLLSLIGSPMTLFPVIPLAAAILWLRRQRRDATILLLGMAGAGTLESIIKLHFRRTRPHLPWAFVHERSFSFPSGHSVLAVVLYGLLAYITMHTLQRAWQRAALILACLTLILAIGLSRIYLGAHYPSDVAAGYFVGATWLLFVIMASRFLHRRDLEAPPHRIGRERVPPPEDQAHHQPDKPDRNQQRQQRSQQPSSAGKNHTVPAHTRGRRLTQIRAEHHQVLLQPRLVRQREAAPEHHHIARNRAALAHVHGPEKTHQVSAQISTHMHRAEKTNHVVRRMAVIDVDRLPETHLIVAPIRPPQHIGSASERRRQQARSK